MLQSPVSLVGQAWQFFKSQPLLNQITGWLFITPLTLSFLCETGISTYQEAIKNTLQISQIQLGVMVFLLQVLFAIWVFWGYGCTLVIGERIVKSKAGRSRTAISAVYNDGRTLVLPLFLTSIIRDCIALLFALPYFLVVVFFLLLQEPAYINGFISVIKTTLLNPSAEVDFSQFNTILLVLLLGIPLLAPVIWYRLRTMLYFIFIGLENKGYREALRASGQLLKGRFWSVVLNLLVISIIIFIPVAIVSGIINNTIINIDKNLFILTSLVDATLTGIAMVIYILATIFLYKDLLTQR